MNRTRLLRVDSAGSSASSYIFRIIVLIFQCRYYHEGREVTESNVIARRMFHEFRRQQAVFICEQIGRKHLYYLDFDVIAQACILCPSNIAGERLMVICILV